MTLISIIIPVYNRPETFKRALASALRQTYEQAEIIVVDDGSRSDIRKQITDNMDTESIPIHFFRQENKGAPAARNLGFSKSKGEYVIFWDADVIAEPEMLEKMLAALQKNPTASYAYSDFYFGRKKMPARPFDSERLKKINYITTTSLLRRADFPGFDESLKKFQDWDLWLTLLEKNKVGVYVPEVLFSVETGGTMSSWLPAFAFKRPWKWVPGIWSKVKKYEQAKRIIVEKHFKK